MNYKLLTDCPVVIKDFLSYMETIRGRSPRTVNGYYVDLRTFMRFMKRLRGKASTDTPFEEIKIDDIDIDFIRTITLSDVYEFLAFTSSELGNGAAARSRKVSALRTFFNFLTVKTHQLAENPVKELEVPSLKKSLPKYLSLEDSLEILNSAANDVDNENKERDYCILTLFLNCGMRLSELVGININDVKNNTLRLLGKGNKERIVYLNDACMAALEAYLKVRPNENKERRALFISRNGNRISTRRVEQIIERQLDSIGLSKMGYSVHKLRHTAATLMYQYGSVDIRLLKDILGHANLGTTEIYTHTSSSQMEKAAKSTPLSKIKPK